MKRPGSSPAPASAPDPHGGPFAGVIAEMSQTALLSNLRAIRRLLPRQGIIPMIKANGYGHGASWVASVLKGEEGIHAFGVATLQEGATVREAVGPVPRILVFSGCNGWTEEKGQFCERHGLTPVIGTDEDWESFLERGWPARLSYHLKFNTGMNRLGLSRELAPAVARALSGKPSAWHPRGILSHLATAEAPASPLSRRQLDGFRDLKSELASSFPSAHFHLGNSAAIWNRKKWDLDRQTDLVRPGIALYGVPPSPEAPTHGIVPVMTLRARVIAVRFVRKGDQVGYGGTYRCRAPGRERMALLGAGYGDGLHRALSGRGEFWYPSKAGPKGHRVAVRGVVSMDLCAIGCPSHGRPGDWVEILGPHIDPWAQAEAAGTLPYELLTSVTTRVQRVYVQGSLGPGGEPA